MQITCRKCDEIKPAADFYKHQYSRISGLGECKECTKSRVRANRLVNLDYYRKYDRERGNRQPPEYLQEYRSKNKAKYAAHNAVNNAIRDGRIFKPGRCETCDSANAIHGHHDDYAKPLDVRWLCAACHRQWHMKHGEAANSQQGDTEHEQAPSRRTAAAAN